MSTPQEIEENKLNAKARRAAKREERKKLMNEREILVAKLGSKPPAERESAFGCRYKDATEDNWEYYDPIGWVHVAEQPGFQRGYAQCSINKTWHSKSIMASLWNGGIICMEEASKNFVLCAHTGLYGKKDDMVEVYMRKNEKGLVIAGYMDDFRRCQVTERFYPKAYLIKIRNPKKYEWVASHLIDGKKFCRCGGCSHYFDAENAPYSQDVGHAECKSCHDTRIIGNLIHPHNFNGYPKPKTSPRIAFRLVGGEEKKDRDGFPYFVGRTLKKVDEPEVRLFGWEAETEISRKTAERAGLNRLLLAKQVMDALGDDFVVIKEDGTLTANEHYSKGTGFSGFEIVTCPADLEMHRKMVPKLHEMPGFAHFRAWDEYDTCGFHVHVSRDSLTHVQVGKMLEFINNQNNAKFIHRVAGRGSDRFCKYIPKEPGDKTHPVADVLHPERVISKQEEDRRNRSRRVALNTSNKNTVEFRIFRGTMHPRHILRNLEFCDAVCDFCYPASFSIKDMADYKVFIEFVGNNRKRWPLLAEWMANQKIIALKVAGDKANAEKMTLKPDMVPESHRDNDHKNNETSVSGFVTARVPAKKSIIELSKNVAKPGDFDELISNSIWVDSKGPHRYSWNTNEKIMNSIPAKALTKKPKHEPAKADDETF